MTRDEKDKLDFTGMSVVVGEPDRDAGREIERQFGILGFKQIKVMRNMERLRQSIANDEADVALCNMQIKGQEAHDLIRGVRNQEVGKNPFLVIYSTVPSSQKNDAADTLNAGPDNLLVRPFSRDIFVHEMTDLATQQRDFIVTSDFVGPSRRAEPRPGIILPAEKFEVPNPAKILGAGGSRDDLWKEIWSASNNLNLRKLQADIKMIDQLVEKIIPPYEMARMDEVVFLDVERLLSIISGLARRADRIGADSVSELTELAGNIVTDINENPSPPNLRNIAALPKIVTGFQVGLLKFD
ncbi:MAG: hypothetical protein HQ503_03265 [Rhodospirillales bacterium]|nr:hypothetical protein [Rhodospirillales bacterium]